MAGHSRPKDGVVSTRLCPGHPRHGFEKALASKNADVDARHKADHAFNAPDRSSCRTD
jgi:hypothetical protein